MSNEKSSNDSSSSLNKPSSSQTQFNHNNGFTIEIYTSQQIESVINLHKNSIYGKKLLIEEKKDLCTRLADQLGYDSNGCKCNYKN